MAITLASLHTRGRFHSLLVEHDHPLGETERIGVQAQHLVELVTAANAAAAEAEVLATLVTERTRELQDLHAKVEGLEGVHQATLTDLAGAKVRADTAWKRHTEISSAALLLYDAVCMARPDLASQVTGLTPKAFARSVKFTEAKVLEAINAWCDL
jgi:hypothetical protein